jgi:hypothetical protein
MSHTAVVMYDVDGPVGRGGSNFPTDVMLVQFVFSAIVLDPSWNTAPVFSNNFMLASGPGAIFPINGVHQPALNDWIASFQAQVNSSTSFGPVATDGRVDPAETGWFRRHRAPHRRTLHVMNHILFIANQTRFERMDSDPRMPSGLQAALRTFRHNI